MDAALTIAALGTASLASLGWLGNACYFMRFFVQWLQSERAGRTVAPKIFWWLSLAGAATLGSYSWLKGDTPLFLGYLLTFFLYLRNISIAHLGPRAGRLGPAPAMALALALGAALLIFGARPSASETQTTAWLVVGFASQAVFSSRFIVQWYHAERSGAAQFPLSFWWMSLVGNVGLLAYAIRGGDPVFIAGFAMGPLVQVRNLILATRDDDEDPEARSETPEPAAQAAH